MVRVAIVSIRSLEELQPKLTLLSQTPNDISRAQIQIIMQTFY